MLILLLFSAAIVGCVGKASDALISGSETGTPVGELEPRGTLSKLGPGELAAVLLRHDELGGDYSDYHLTPGSGPMAEDGAGGPIEAGRISGYGRYYTTERQGPSNPWVIGSSLEVFVDELHATQALKRLLEEPLGEAEFGRLPETVVADHENFSFDSIGDAAYVQYVTVVESFQLGTKVTWSRVLVRRQNVITTVLLVLNGDQSERLRPQQLAALLDSRVVAAINGEVDDLPPLSGRDLLLEAQNQMRGLTSVHIRELLSASIGVATFSREMDFDIEFPGLVIGTMQMGIGPTVEFHQSSGSVIVRDPDYNRADSEWSCIEVLNNGANAKRLGLTFPDLSEEVYLTRLSQVRLDSSYGADNEVVYVVSLEMSAVTYRDEVAALLGAHGLLDSLPDSITNGEAKIEFHVSKHDFQVIRYFVDLAYELPDGTTVARIQSESELSQLKVAPQFPDPTTLPECSKYDLPCKGRNLDACLIPPDELLEPNLSRSNCEGDAPRLCLVPMGAVDPELLGYLAERYSEDLSIDVRVLPGMLISQTAIHENREYFDERREQFDGDQLLELMKIHYRELDDDENVTLIGITPLDITQLLRPTVIYAFAVREFLFVGTDAGVVSYFRMREESWGNPPDRPLLESRLWKMTTKYVGLFHFGFLSSQDPTSVLYHSIGGLFDLDRMGEELPTQP